MSRLRIRALQPFRIRNRYIRGSTFRNGHTLPLTSMTSPKYSPIHVSARDVAGRVAERSVRVELPVLDHQRDLVRAAGDPDGVGLAAGVELVAQDVGGGEAGEDVQSRRSQGRDRGTIAARPASAAADWCRRRVCVSPGPNPFGVTAGLPSLSAATKPPCRCVITRTSSPSGVEPRVDRDPARVRRRKLVL